MNTTLKRIGLLFSIGMLSAQVARAATVYDGYSSSTYLDQFSQVSGAELGNEIVLSGTEKFITDFSYVFWTKNLSGNESMRLRLYRNDSQSSLTNALKPGTMIFDSGFFFTQFSWGGQWWP